MEIVDIIGLITEGGIVGIVIYFFFVFRKDYKDHKNESKERFQNQQEQYNAMIAEKNAIIADLQKQVTKGHETLHKESKQMIELLQAQETFWKDIRSSSHEQQKDFLDQYLKEIGEVKTHLQQILTAVLK